MKNFETKLEDESWCTGSGQVVEFEDICFEIDKYLNRNIKVFIGADSDVSRQQITFCKAICIYGMGSCGFYYFAKTKAATSQFPNLVSRITEETRLSIELAELLSTKRNVPLDKIEVHLDVSPFDSGAGTSKFSEMLRGYVSGAGFSCKIKPNAWASQSVADKHSK